MSWLNCKSLGKEIRGLLPLKFNWMEKVIADNEIIKNSSKNWMLIVCVCYGLDAYPHVWLSGVRRENAY